MGTRNNKLFFVFVLFTTWLPCGIMAQEPVREREFINFDAESAGKNVDGKKILIKQTFRDVLLHDAKTGNEVGRFPGKTIICSNFKRLATIEKDTVTNIIDAETGEKLATLSEYKAWVEAKFSADGSRLITFSEDVMRYTDDKSNCTIRTWNAVTGEKISEFSCNSNWYYPFLSSPDGKIIATCSGDFFVQIWNADTGKSTVKCTHEKSILTAGFSPDSKIFFTASYDNAAKIWNVAAGNNVSAVLPGLKSEVYNIVFSDDSKQLATWSEDFIVNVWDTTYGRQIASCIGHNDDIISVTFSADGKNILTHSYDSTARIWNASTGEEIVTYELSGEHESIVFRHDGKKFCAMTIFGMPVYEFPSM